MKPLNLLAVLWLVPAMTGAFAQTSVIPVPKNPMVHRAPAFASWTITFTYNGEKPAGSANLIQSMTVTKTNKTYWEQTTWSAGNREEKWISDGNQLETAGNGKVIIIIRPPSAAEPSPDYSDYNRSDFPGLEWVSSGNYKGIETHQETPFFHFETADKKEALLSIETQLPLFSTDSSVSSTYTYNPPPTAPLIVPKRFLDVLDIHKTGLERYKYHPSLP